MNKQEIMSVLADEFKKLDIEMDRDDDKALFSGVINLGGTLGLCRLFVLVANDGVTCVTMMGQKTPTDRIPELAQLICQLNYSLRWGNFDLDCTDGEVRYYYLMPVDEFAADPESKAREVIGLPLKMLNDYSSNLNSVMFNGVSGQDAIAALNSKVKA